MRHIYKHLEAVQKYITRRSILRNACFQLLDNIIQSITEKFQQFSFIRKQSYNIIKEKISSNQLLEICNAIKKEKESLSFTMLKRQQSKYQRDNITILTIHRKIEGLESRSEDITIISGSYYIEKKREKLFTKLKQHVQIRTLLT